MQMIEPISCPWTIYSSFMVSTSSVRFLSNVKTNFQHNLQKGTKKSFFGLTIFLLWNEEHDFGPSYIYHLEKIRHS